MGWTEETGRLNKPVRAVAYDLRTRRRCGTKSFATEREARDWITFREEQIANLYRSAGSEYPDRKPSDEPDTPTFAEYARSRVPLVPEWSSKATRHHRSKIVETEVASYFGETIRVNEVTKNHVRGMLAAARDRGVEVSGRKGKLACFRRIFEYAIDDGYCSSNPTRGITLPSGSKKRPRSLDESEIAAIAANMPDWLHAAVWVSADAGLRIGEVCGLQVGDVDLLHRKLWVKHVIDDDGSLRDFPKGRDVLAVPMTNRLHAALERHIKDHYDSRSGYMFTLPNGNAMQPDSIRNRFYRAYAETGNPNPRPVWHDLRHNTANKLKDAGAPVYVIQAILRHKNIATTQQYIDTVSESDLRQWADRASGGGQVSSVP